MKSSRPYLARALYEWLLDNELTPYLVVDATLPGVEVPRQFVQNGQIVLNVAPTAVRDLFMENQAIGFNARFGGQPMQVMIPTPALIAIYARENGAGMVFGHEPELGDGADSFGAIEDEEKPSSKPELSITEPVSEKSDSDSTASADTSEKESQAKSKTKKKPTLRVVK
ncbi:MULTISPECIES: ClpXP protease specificity-enhancing factor [Halomonadaceae]|jgi:stringent starvation protein B|uniref:Stringent starvation protein B n=2 Tax=Vreelandella titanicae TaxID=664683 RepID=L9U905_9GAMM|nr:MULTISPECIES: ClpXP protease specificity-enhancing factor [Halomonas]NAO97366.1 ClpXP protease specificity-enhancing factor [Halomonas sp. MG34]QGQ70189.1 ClpXP protease specificity-enhancing factor [Halomonas sp. PA16-9]UEQ05942.1 ClpXP protease specificity-enhancing factor [Halomonas profundus]ELY21101.1 Stringent starvation protein B [Halomonas titanicae BH1]KIN16594.1 peptidase [Halomonas sp. KHS3]|tara:strand:+ start:913 stop:1419 length:507 start_codon:yes stop_codon:yes gene_type:complete